MADITMPQLGETVTEGTITQWFKEVGDEVAEDEVLFEVSTDKVDTEVPSPVGGTLAEIRVPEGDTVDVGTVLAVEDFPEARKPAWKLAIVFGADIGTRLQNITPPFFYVLHRRHRQWFYKPANEASKR